MCDGRRVEPIRGRRRWASHHFYDRARDELQTLSSGASKRTIPATEVVVVTEFWRLDATAQAALVREKSVKPTELVDAAIARIESLNPKLNAVVTEMFDRARAEAMVAVADGPFAGVPFPLGSFDPTPD